MRTRQLDRRLAKMFGFEFALGRIIILKSSLYLSEEIMRQGLNVKQTSQIGAAKKSGMWTLFTLVTTLSPVLLAADVLFRDSGTGTHGAWDTNYIKDGLKGTIRNTTDGLLVEGAPKDAASVDAGHLVF